MGRKQGHARELADLVERPVKDYDPEADVVPSESDHSGDDSSDNEPLGTEHYVTVGKSKLRHHEPLSLGPQYRGTRVSREALEADDDEAEDDEEVSDVDEDDDDEDDDDEDDDDGDASSHHEDARVKQLRHTSRDVVKKTKHAKRPTATDFMGSDDEDEIDEDDDLSDGSEMEGFIDDEAEEGSDDDEPAFSDEEEEEDELSNDGSDEDEDEDEDEEENGQDPRAAGHKKSKSLNGSGIVASVKEMMGEQSVVKSLLRTVDADVQKGRAVQRQRKSFDALLNIRIRLQKSIVAVNSLEYADQVEEQTPEPYEAAEKSALQLWNALDEFRTTIHKGKKRKHTETDDTSTAALWDRMALHEKHQAARRKQVLEKWSRDAKKTSITASSAHKFSSNTERPITAMLSAEMDAPERLIKRTRTPRSCAPYHVAQKINEDNSIYDDADFYQLLLKELVDQRSGDGSGPGLQAATIRYAAVKEAKAKRHVDTKASKGRKMRFTPMPKLQNFMASEDRRSWEQSAIDRFFGTLFGQKLVLDEEVSDEEMGGVSMEDGGLRLFRS
ncbi:putative transcription factor AATF Che-1 [Rosellinia necatrix]|uniref:Protein BFR2 n=1 Tax=Rosellinia necatrix TaxID=77044 RepID=A0A1W2TJ71_ROSNE|nr:putative transcription factor AATF Che-1 [Rosellinia necatrix]